MFKKVLLVCLLMIVALAVICGCTRENPFLEDPTIDSILKEIKLDDSTYFKTVQNVATVIRVVNGEGSPVKDVYLAVYEKEAQDHVLFKGLSDEDGIAAGNVLVRLAKNRLVVHAEKEGQIVASQETTVSVGQATANITLTVAGDQQVSGMGVLPDDDGDGVPDLYDDFRGDASRAFVIEYPTLHVAYEDFYPITISDRDVNDLVVKLDVEMALNRSGYVKNVNGNAKLMARGAATEYSSSYYIRYLLQKKIGRISVAVKEYGPDGGLVRQDDDYKPGEVDSLSLELFTGTSSKFATANPALINTRVEVPYYSGGQADFSITFGEPVHPLYLSLPPFDSYLMVDNPETGLIYDIHLPYSSAIENSNNPDTEPFRYFIDDKRFPYAIIVPDTWLWPVEGVRVMDAYPSFMSWIQSGFSDHSEWYLNPDASKVYDKHLTR